MKKEKSVIIIGAGLGGLSAGCYSRMNGYRTRILEKHFLPGGNCTSWKRGKYIFDPCISWLMGTRRGTEMGQIWRELGATQGREIINFDCFNNIVGKDGRVLRFFIDPDKLEAHLKELSPEDEKPIKKYCNALRLYNKGSDVPFLKPGPLFNLFDGMKIFWKLKHLGPISDWVMNTRMLDFSKEFKDPLLQEAFNHIFYLYNQGFVIVPSLHILGYMNTKHAGYPAGGSLDFAQSIANRFTELGGEIQYRAEVKKILTCNNRAYGVELTDGTRQFADIIISAADWRHTLYKLLNAEFVDARTEELRYNLENKNSSRFQAFTMVFLGVRDALEDMPHNSTFLLGEEELKLMPDNLYHGLAVMNRSKYDPLFAPKGHSVVFCFYYGDYDYWKKIYPDKELYNQEKRKLAGNLIAFLAKRYPRIKDKVEEIDVSTPVTIERYTNNYKGSIMGWSLFDREDELISELTRDNSMGIPGLANCYMTGHWMSFGGTIRAATSGRHVMQFICRDDRKKFRAVTA